MKVAGGCLIALAIMVTWMILSELALGAMLHPVGFGEYVSTFFKYSWPGGIALVVGVLLWRYKPKNRIY
jgi:hypothetical protein